ncbi:MAG TPA: cation diffusion facilitator family transporter [Candidatus Dormibacteraeota bacterium]|nr:cation diffusion facilitator family transporter [Candidatus Dormibacteraeota bacterium]
MNKPINSSPGHSHDHGHDDHNHNGHSHTHGLVDPSIVRSKAGVKAVSISFGVLLITALVQLWIFTTSHSVALLADTIHNAGDALTAIPLGLAFFFRSKRGEQLSGYLIVLLIFSSAIITLYQVINRFIHPHTPSHLLAILVAGIIGVLGNEFAAVIRWRAGKQLDSPALIADGNHARTDGIVSAGVILSTILIGIGLPIADPLIGLAIVALILRSSWQSWQTIKRFH